MNFGFSIGVYRRSSAANQRGFTYMVMLFAVAISGIMLAAASVVWSQQVQRERERELLLIGNEFRRAIGLYYERTPGAVKRYPEKLEDLLRDDRYLSLQRYLRRIYRDPITGTTEWGLVPAPIGGIMGVYSVSEDRPIKTGGFDETDRDLEGRSRYSDWRFVYTPAPPSDASSSKPPVAAGKYADSGEAGPAFRSKAGQRSGACRAGCDAVSRLSGRSILSSTLLGS